MTKQDIIPNALIENVDASVRLLVFLLQLQHCLDAEVVVQKKMKNLNVELIVRGAESAPWLEAWQDTSGGVWLQLTRRATGPFAACSCQKGRLLS